MLYAANYNALIKEIYAFLIQNIKMNKSLTTQYAYISQQGLKVGFAVLTDQSISWYCDSLNNKPLQRQFKVYRVKFLHVLIIILASNKINYSITFFKISKQINTNFFVILKTYTNYLAYIHTFNQILFIFIYLSKMSTKKMITMSKALRQNYKYQKYEFFFFFQVN
ncbi:transmembrane protein, putative (macronuclear) [Tetrahymena thermophila SB210]|uniref:Transmembrane protein, putative n=1 Tax=Tetrahymena thermophila (strain SB210) TaxID=312017 RepID=W7XJN0_TETTS|nr:transmembrane protein, putative [Tetrahymena thermophila SB210]EWS75686.1 transmembrane protein, putative [Tetrahymena thermophila SB210]|eukprot:XP_012651759.1 transmembrane protein, putative [Tetrahymena thermophila SB210]